MSKQTLTIGRIVHFVPPSEDHPTANNSAQVVPALVTAVINENCANLTVFPDNREPLCITSAQYSQSGTAGSWRWPQDEVKDETGEKETAKETVTGTSGEDTLDSKEQ